MLEKLQKYIEYIKLVPQGIANLPEIVESMRTNIKMQNGELEPEFVEEILRRRLICKFCEYNSIEAKKSGKYKGRRVDEFCTLCHCVIENKTACLDCECGVGYYNEKHPESPKELKWTAINRNNEEEKI